MNVPWIQTAIGAGLGFMAGELDVLRAKNSKAAYLGLAIVAGAAVGYAYGASTTFTNPTPPLPPPPLPPAPTPTAAAAAASPSMQGIGDHPVMG